MGIDALACMHLSPHNRPDAVVSEGIRESWWRQGMMGGIKAQFDCIKALSESESSPYTNNDSCV